MPTYRYDELLAHEEEIPPVLIEGLLNRGSKLILGGEAKKGKSFVLHSILYALATGTPLFGNPDFVVPEAVPGILFSQELGFGELKRRWSKYATAGGVQKLTENLFLTPKDAHLYIDTSEGETLFWRYIEALIKRDVKPAWIAIDPISKIHSRNENAQEDVAKILYKLDRLQADFGSLAIILVHHHGHPTLEKKQAGRTGGALLRGSSYFYADADTLVTLDRLSPMNAKSPLFRIEFETRHGEPIQPGWVRLNGDTALTNWEKYLPASEEG